MLLIAPRRVASRWSPSASEFSPMLTASLSLFFSLSPSFLGWQRFNQPTDHPITFLHATGKSKLTLACALIYQGSHPFMSTTRALLPRPAASYALRIVSVVVVEKLSLSCTSHPRHWELPTKAADGIERRESSRRRRWWRRRRVCNRIGVARASLRWATMAAYIWIILKQPRVFSRTKWYTHISWPAPRQKDVLGRYVTFFLACDLHPIIHSHVFFGATIRIRAT